jgi:hypothetical protein
MQERFNRSVIVLYDFIRNPFKNSVEEVDDDKSLVFIASILSGFTVIVRYLCTPMNDWVSVAFLLGGLLLTPLFGLLIVHFKGAIFSLYLGFFASKLINENLFNLLKSKQIMTFSTIGLIVSSVPSLTNVGILIGLLIEILGIYRLFQIDLKKSILIAIIYHALWWGLIYLIAKGTSWI